MPLSLLARDSIQDLENFGRGTSGIRGSAPNGNKNALQVESSSDAKAHNGANAPQQEESSPTSSPQTESSTTSAETAASRQSSNGPSKAASPVSSYGQYSGFRSDYHDFHDDSYYYHETYASPFVNGRKTTANFWEGLLPCLFPWTSSQGRLLDSEEDAVGSGNAGGGSSNANHRGASKDEDEVSNSSEIMGEKLSEKERMAVLNRLRLGQPDAVQSDHSSSDGSDEKKEKKKKGLLNGIPSYETTNGGKIKGILKNAVPKPPPPPTAKKPLSEQANAAQRRSLFPQYSGVGSFYSSTNNKGVNVSFAPMARVVTVKHRNDMDGQEKGDIWWQRVDYDDFRKTGRMITRAMLEGGSNIWLSSQSSTSNAKTDDDPADTISAQGDKWWHKFGHSRRGLEHVVSIDEGRQRQLNVKRAIQAVLEEQARQRLGRRQDAERLRHVSMQYTSWARDLALASGASDADAVQSKFADDRKSREFYLLKIARNSPLQGGDRHVPDFMQPALQAVASPRLAKQSMPSPHVLDANTAAQIRYRRKSQLTSEPKKEEMSEPVHDPENKDSNKKESIARRAAGFSAEGDEKVNMAAVLSGMGAVPQNTQVLSTA